MFYVGVEVNTALLLNNNTFEFIISCTKPFLKTYCLPTQCCWHLAKRSPHAKNPIWNFALSIIICDCSTESHIMPKIVQEIYIMTKLCGWYQKLTTLHWKQALIHGLFSDYKYLLLKHPSAIRCKLWGVVVAKCFDIKLCIYALET